MISTTRKSGLPSAIVVAAAIAGLGVAHAQYPERGLTLIVPYGAGGGTDVTARLLARDLEAAMGKSVTVENRAGGGGWLGWGAWLRRRPMATRWATSMCPACTPAISIPRSAARRPWTASRR